MSYARNLARLARSGMPVGESLFDIRNLVIYDGLYPHAVNTTGYAEKGDGGDGDFFWDADSALPDDDGTVLLPIGHSGPGRWVRTDRAKKEWHIDWFGPQADGVTNDKVVIQAAIDRLAESGGGWLNFTPQKVYAVSHLDVKARVVLSGPSTPSRKIYAYHSGDAVLGPTLKVHPDMASEDNAYFISFYTDQINSGVEALSIDASDMPATNLNGDVCSCVNFSGDSWTGSPDYDRPQCFLREVYIWGGGGGADSSLVVVSPGHSGALVEQCILRAAASRGTYHLGYGIWIANGAVDTKIYDTSGFGFLHYGVHINAGSVRFERVEFWWCAKASYYLGPYTVAFMGIDVKASDSQRHGIVIDGARRVDLTQGLFFSNGYAGDATANYNILLSGDHKNVSVTGCSFRDADSANGGYLTADIHDTGTHWESMPGVSEGDPEPAIWEEVRAGGHMSITGGTSAQDTDPNTHIRPLATGESLARHSFTGLNGKFGLNEFAWPRSVLNIDPTLQATEPDSDMPKDWVGVFGKTVPTFTRIIDQYGSDYRRGLMLTSSGTLDDDTQGIIYTIPDAENYAGRRIFIRFMAQGSGSTWLGNQFVQIREARSNAGSELIKRAVIPNDALRHWNGFYYDATEYCTELKIWVIADSSGMGVPVSLSLWNLRVEV